MFIAGYNRESRWMAFSVAAGFKEREVGIGPAIDRTFRHRKLDSATADPCPIQTKGGAVGLGSIWAPPCVRVVGKQKGNRG
jgi:hypothetical protein